MKPVLKSVFLSTLLLSCTAAIATPMQDQLVDSTLISTADIELVLHGRLDQNISKLTTAMKKPDMETLFAKAQLTRELNNFVAQATSELPKNKFKVILGE